MSTNTNIPPRIIFSQPTISNNGSDDDDDHNHGHEHEHEHEHRHIHDNPFDDPFLEVDYPSSNQLPSPNLSIFTTPSHKSTKPSLKISIPSPTDEDSDSSILPSPLPPTIKNLNELENDLTSVLDNALFSTSWMPTHNNPNSNPNPNPNVLQFPLHSNHSTSTSNSTLRYRRKPASSDSFHDDLEANDAIPLNDLNLDSHTASDTDIYTNINEPNMSIISSNPPLSPSSIPFRLLSYFNHISLLVNADSIELKNFEHQNNEKNNDEEDDNDHSDDDPNDSHSIIKYYLETLHSPTFVPFNFKNSFTDKTSTYLYGNSLKFFPSTSKIRQFSHYFVTNHLSNQLSFILLVLQIGLTTYQQWNYKNGYVYNAKYTWIDWILFAFYLFYTFEMFMKIIAFGLIDDSQLVKSLNLKRYENKLQLFYKKIFKKFFKSRDNQHIDSSNSIFDNYNVRYAYLRTDWNRIDFISILSFWISFALSFNNTDTQKAQVFRSLMCLRILRFLNVFKSSRLILRSLKDATLQSNNVLLFLLCFWVLFSIIGVESFKTSLRRHCVWENPTNSSDIYINEFQFCGSYIDAITSEVRPYINEFNINSQTIKGFTCPVNSRCILGENPYNGRVSFDNIVQSMQSVFVIMSANTFTDLMYYTMDSDSMAASLFYIISIFILVVWLVNLFIAVILNSYKMENHDEENDNNNSCKIRKEKYVSFFENSKILQFYKKFDIIFILIISIWFIISCFKRRSDGKFDDKYNTCDFVTSIILLVEIIFRFFLVSYESNWNWKIFFYSDFNTIDLSIGILSFIFSLPPIYKSISSLAYGWLSFFAILRFYRIIVFIKPIKNAWETALKKIKPILELILFSIILLYLIAIIMSRLFEGVVPVDNLDDNSWTMYNLPNCFVSLFIITTTENWTGILYALEENANSTFSAACYAIYLIFWFILSNTIILSLFIALITNNLELSENEKRINQIKQFIKSCVERVHNKKSSNDGLYDLFKNNFDRNFVSEDANILINKMNEILISNGNQPINIDEYYDHHSLSSKKLTNIRNYLHRILNIDKLIAYKNLYITKFKTKILKRNKNQDENNNSNNSNNETETDIEVEEQPLLNGNQGNEKQIKIDRSLFIFTNENPIRRFCQIFVAPSNIQRVEGRHPSPRLMYIFNVFMFLTSVVCVVLACYETPLYRLSQMDQQDNYRRIHLWTVYPDIVFMVLFSIEFAIKIIADGFLFGDRAYIKSAWNCIDLIVLNSFWIIVISVLNNNYSIMITFGAFRALRAFRLLTITKESQMVFQLAILSGAMKIVSATLVSLSLLIPFSLWGLNIFNNQLSGCSDGTSTNFNCSLEFTNQVFKWEITSPNYVQTPELHFDSFSSSLQTLFEILSLEGWVDLLSNLMNITQFDYPSETFSSPGNGIFVIIFIFVATIFITNLFISLIINNYKVQTGNAFLNNDQYGWYEVKKVLSRVKPSRRKDDGKLTDSQKKIYKFITQRNGIWQNYINLILFMHFCVLLSEGYPDFSSGETIRSSIFIFTISNLLIHLLLFQYSLGFNVFYSNRFNIFIMVIMLVSLTLSIISFQYYYVTSFYNINKAFLVSILYLVTTQSDVLNQLFKYGSTGLFSLFTLIYTWLILFLVFAIALNQKFGLTKLGSSTNGNLNTRTVTKSLIMLFRHSFGEGWNYVMKDFEVTSPYCTTNSLGESDCGNVVIAKVLFIIWNILSMYIFLNILISVVINNFSYVYHGSGPHKLITREEIRKFKRCWNKFDINGTGYIYDSDLYKFLHSLDGILSYHVYSKIISIPNIQKNVTDDGNGNGGNIDEYYVSRRADIFNYNSYNNERTIDDFNNDFIINNGADNGSHMKNISYDNVYNNQKGSGSVFNFETSTINSYDNDYDDTNGYDFKINLNKLNEILSLIDYSKIRLRRRRFERLVCELFASSKKIINNDGDEIKKIPFNEALTTIGYYSRFEDSTCLNLEDFLRRSIQINLINRELRKEKILSTIKMMFTRLRYKYLTKNYNISQLLQSCNSRTERDNLKSKIIKFLNGKYPSIDEILTFQNSNRENEIVEDFEVYDNNPIFNDNLYRVMSQRSTNPFSDIYGINQKDKKIDGDDNDDDYDYSYDDYDLDDVNINEQFYHK